MAMDNFGTPCLYGRLRLQHMRLVVLVYVLRDTLLFSCINLHLRKGDGILHHTLHHTLHHSPSL